MSFIKSLIAFLIGVALLFVFYAYINIPIIHCIYIYAIANIFSDDKYKGRIFFIIIGALLFNLEKKVEK